MIVLINLVNRNQTNKKVVAAVNIRQKIGRNVMHDNKFRELIRKKIDFNENNFGWFQWN